MKSNKCTAPVRGHKKIDDELKCPVHSRVAKARMDMLAPPHLRQSPGAIPTDDFSGGNVEVTIGTLPVRNLRISGSLTIKTSIRAENCHVGMSISAERRSVLENCHVVDLEQDPDDPMANSLPTNRQEFHPLVYNQRDGGYLRVNEEAAAVNCSARWVSGTHAAHFEDCHATMDFSVSGEVTVQNCTAERAFIFERFSEVEIRVTAPGQILVYDEDVNADGHEYPEDTTFIVPKDHPWNFALTGNAPGAGFAWARSAMEEMERIAPTIEMRRALTVRPKDNSEGCWVDARNEAAWDYLVDIGGVDFETKKVDEELLAVALSVKPNPY